MAAIPNGRTHSLSHSRLLDHVLDGTYAVANLAVALDLAQEGLPIFPAEVVHKGDRWTKKPIIKDWQSLATTDPNQIKRWWHVSPHAVAGIELGRAGLIIIDADRHGGPDGVREFHSIAHDLPPHPTVLTPGDGEHHTFMQDSDARLGNGRGALPKGIDVRGAGGWIVAPGAIRPDGRRWEPTKDAPPLGESFKNGTIPALPACLAERIRSRPESAYDGPVAPICGERRPMLSASREKNYAQSALRGAAHDLGRTSEGGRNEALNAAAYHLGRMVARGWIDQIDVVDELSKAGIASGLPVGEVQTTLASGLTAGIQNPAEDLSDRPMNETGCRAGTSNAEASGGVMPKLVWSRPCVAEKSAQPEGIERLALLDVFEYERVRDAEAKRLGVRVGVLDGEIRKRRREDQNESMGFLEPPVPWDEPVDGSALAEALEATTKRYVVLPDHAPITTTMWVLMAHAFDCFEIAPVLAIESPEKRCGKTTLLSLMQPLVPKALTAANMTPAAVFRSVEAFKPTLIIDEADTFLTSDNPELVGILNSGHTRASAFVVRVVGDNHDVKQFSTWCPKAIALIGELPPTLQDRSIAVRMRRRQKSETVERRRGDRLQPLHELCRKAARWAADHAEHIRTCDPDVPAQLDDRAADNWRPLLAIAEALGPDWLKRAQEAAKALSGARSDDDETGGSAF